MKVSRLFGVLVLSAVAAFIIYGCPGVANGPRPEDRAELRQDVQEGINRIDQYMQALQDSLPMATGIVRDRMMQQQEILRARRNDLNQRMNNIDTVPAEQWDEFRNSTEQTLDDLDTILGTMEDELEDMREQQRNNNNLIPPLPGQQQQQRR